MNKIPVGQTIAAAYRFAFVGLEKVIALIWLPIITLTVVGYFSESRYLAAMAAAIDSGDQTRVLPVAVSQLGFAFITIVLQAVIAVAIVREILKPLDRPQWLRFSLGGAEFRVVGAMFGVGLLAALAAVILMIAGSILGGMLPLPGLAPAQKAIGMAGLLGLLLSPLLIYMFVRVAGLIVPAATIDGGFGMERSWLLLKGNVGRLFVVTVAAGLPVLLVYLALYTMILGPENVFSPLNAGGDLAGSVHDKTEKMRQIAEHLPYLKGLEFVMAPFLYGLGCAAPAFAYKALAGAAKK